MPFSSAMSRSAVGNFTCGFTRTTSCKQSQGFSRMRVFVGRPVDRAPDGAVVHMGWLDYSFSRYIHGKLYSYNSMPLGSFTNRT